MSKRSQYIVVAAVILLVLVLLNLPPGTVTRLKLAVGGLFLPLFGLSSAGQQVAEHASATIMPRRELVSENERLRQEIEQLHIQAAQAEEIRKENDRLRALVGWQRTVPWKLKLARVVAHDTANWWRTVQIDLGRRDGVTNNMPVLTRDGLLVGRISSAGLARSQVVLVGSPDCQVSALVADTREQGIITAGSGAPLENAYVMLTSLPNSGKFSPGQKVVTSGQGLIFPRGIPVGTIADVRSVEFGLYKEAQVKLAANLSTLEEVWVMIQ